MTVFHACLRLPTNRELNTKNKNVGRINRFAIEDVAINVSALWRSRSIPDSGTVLADALFQRHDHHHAWLR